MSRMFSIGQSKQGRQMYALELSNNPGRVEAKPNARFVGNMHGDEPASRYCQSPVTSKLHICACLTFAGLRQNPMLGL